MSQIYGYLSVRAFLSFQNFRHNYPLKVCCRNSDDLLGDPNWVLAKDGKTKVFCIKPCKSEQDCPIPSKCVDGNCVEGIELTYICQFT